MLITSKGAGMVYPHKTNEDGVVVAKNVDADNQAGDPEQAEAVTGRPNDYKLVEQKPAVPNSTFGSRQKTSAKAMTSDDAENKSASGRQTKKK